MYFLASPRLNVSVWVSVQLISLLSLCFFGVQIEYTLRTSSP